MPLEDPPSTLLTRVGQRVRAARADRGWSRQVLAETSGVSLRYLAQIEGGTGNTSLTVLDRVATALARDVAWFVAPPDTDRGDARAARICLVGLRGAGKSTLGRMAAEQIGIPFVELNAEIEAKAGMPVTEIIALYGQDGYRRFEADALDQVVADRDRVILAAAGGIVAEPETYQRLLQRFHSVWVKASPVEHMERVRAQGDLRPMEGNPQAMKQLRALLATRESEYGRAKHQVDTRGECVETSLDTLLSIVSSINCGAAKG